LLVRLCLDEEPVLVARAADEVDPDEESGA